MRPAAGPTSRPACMGPRSPGSCPSRHVASYTERLLTLARREMRCMPWHAVAQVLLAMDSHHLGMHVLLYMLIRGCHPAVVCDTRFFP